MCGLVPRQEITISLYYLPKINTHIKLNNIQISNLEIKKILPFRESNVRQNNKTTLELDALALEHPRHLKEQKEN